MKTSIEEQLDEHYIDEQLKSAKEWLALTTANINPERRAEIWKTNSFLRWAYDFDDGNINFLAHRFFFRKRRVDSSQIREKLVVFDGMLSVEQRPEMPYCQWPVAV